MEYGTLARVASKQNFTYNQQIKSHKSNLQPSVNFQQHVSKAAQHILATNTESRIRSLSTVLFSDCPSKWPYILSSFDEAAHTMGLNTSWSKTKIQNLGHGVTPASVQLQGHVVESTDRFTYLGSDIHSSERSTPEILTRIGLASNIFGRRANIWKRTGLSLQTNIGLRLYNVLVIFVLIYGSETWTLLKADERRLEAFHMNCQRRILSVGSILSRTPQSLAKLAKKA